MKTNLEHIQSFIKVIELGSFSAAATRMNISKSIVSKHVTALEYALKTQLIQRSTRKLSLTELGEIFYRQIKNVPEQLHRAQESLQSFTEVPRGQLKVLSPDNFCSSLKLQVVPNFLSKFPGVTLDLSFVRPVEDHLSKGFDIAIMWKMSHQTFPDYNLIAKKIISLPAGVFASKKYLAENGIPKTPEDLKNHVCFSSIGNRWPFSKAGSKQIDFLEVPGNLKTKNEEMIHAVTAHDLGLAFSYPFLYEKELLEGSVVQVLQEYMGALSVEIYAFYHPTEYLPLKIKAFIEEMKAYYSMREQEL